MNKVNFAAVLFNARLCAELSQDAVGDMVGVSRATIAHWEAGVHSPNLEKAVFLSRALKFSLDQDFEFRTREAGEERIQRSIKNLEHKLALFRSKKAWGVPSESN